MLAFKLLFRLAALAPLRWKLTSFSFVLIFLSMAMDMAHPYLFSILIDKVLVGRDLSWLYPVLGLSLGFAAASLLLGVFKDLTNRYLDTRTTLDLREVLLAHLRRLPLSEIEKHGPGKFTPLIAGDTAAVSNFLYHILAEMTIQIATMILAVTMIFVMNPGLGLTALLTIPVLIFIPRLFKKQMGRVAQQMRSHNEKVGTHFFECIQGSREIRAFGLEDWEEGRNKALYKDVIAFSSKDTLYRTVTSQLGHLLVSVIIVLLYGFGSGQILEGTLTIGLLTAAVQYFNNALRPVQMLNNFFADMKRSEVSMARIEEFLALAVEPPRTIKTESERRHAAAPEGGIFCRDLNVTYEGTPILKGLNFRIRTGEIAAFVGPSGSGKTTLFKTLMGFMPMSSGEIEIDGRPMPELSRQDLTKKVGMMFQESFIFAGTLYENIALGDLAAGEEAVLEAARKAGLKDFIARLPEGLQTTIGNQGFKLSGGERQRLAIARVVLKRPEILILDEPTSALDRATEGEVLGELHAMMRGKTTLVSSHRLETILSADTIYVLDQGRIIDSGKHAELEARCPVYRNLVHGRGQERIEKRPLEVHEGVRV